MPSADEDEEVQLPDPASQVVALDDGAWLTLGPKIFQRGPMLLLSIDAGRTIRVLDGPPSEAESRTVCTITARDVPPGGLWLAPGTCVVAKARTKLRAHLACPYLMELSAPLRKSKNPKRTGETPGQLIERLLGRFGVALRSSKTLRYRERITVEVPFEYYQRMVEVMERMNIDVLAVKSQLRAKPAVRRGHLQSVPRSP